VTISGNTSGNGAEDSGGGGLYNDDYGTANFSNLSVTGNTASGGGGIGNHGTLYLSNFVISGNSARCSDCGPGGGGGGIGTAGSIGSSSQPAINGLIDGNHASCTNCAEEGSEDGFQGSGGGIATKESNWLADVTISNNDARCSHCEYHGGGGGGMAVEYGTQTLTNVTIANNTAYGCSGLCTEEPGFGGGVASDDDFGSSTSPASNLTIAGNAVSGNAIGAGFVNDSYTYLQGSLLANNGGSDCGPSTSINSLGYNITDDHTCSLAGPGDSIVSNALLGPLAANGGPGLGADSGTPMLTVGLEPGSPALDHIPSPNPCPSTPPYPQTDERGVTRPQSAGCDSGAFEGTVTPPSSGGGGGGGVVVGGGGLPSTPTVTPTPAPATSTPSPTATLPPGCTPGAALTTVAEQPGWNLGGGPAGTIMTGAAGLFSLPAGASGYVSVPLTTPLSALEGVWAFYFSPTTVTLPCVTASSTTLTLTANQTALVSDPFDGPAILSGSAAPTWAIAFNAATNTWSGWTRIDGGSTLTLPAGGAAFVATLASGGSTVTVAP
jgi:hypothetical protein